MYIEKRYLRKIAKVFQELSLPLRLLDADGACIVPEDGPSLTVPASALASGIICGAYYALTRWYAENPSNLSQMFGGQLVPLADVWYYLVGGFALLGFVLCGIGTATSIRKHLNV